MGTSFVSLDVGGGRRGFWMNDGVLELWLRLLALHIEDPASPGSPARAIRDEWLLASRGIFNGCVPSGLGTALALPGGEGLVRAAIQSLLDDLATGPTHLDRGVLNLMGFAGHWGGDFETRRLTEVGRAWLDLLDGKVTTGADDASFMPGSGR